PDEECVLLFVPAPPTISGGAADAHCTFGNQQLALCEMPRAQLLGCNLAFDPCRYRVVSNPLTHDDAVAACDRPHEHLVTIESPDEQAAIDMLAGQRYWLDGSFASGAWTTASGCAAWFDWGAGQPDFGSGSRTTAMREAGAARTADPSELAIAVCEIE